MKFRDQHDLVTSVYIKATCRLDIEHESQLIVMQAFYPEALCTLSSVNSRIKWEKSISSVSLCSIGRITRLLRRESVTVDRR